MLIRHSQAYLTNGKSTMSKTIFIPAAGLGTRFSKLGLRTPKPLIKVNEETLLEKSISSFSVCTEDIIIIATQEIHKVKKIMKSKIENLFPNNLVEWVELNNTPPGQLATSFMALDQINEMNIIPERSKLYIHNCDTGFAWSPTLEDFSTFGLMAVFEADGNHWSFGKPSPNDPSLAIEIAEKKRISSLASIGLYGFQSLQHFLESSRNFLIHGTKVNNEYYIAPMLQSAITEGKSLCIPRVESVKLFGTPEELCKTFNISVNDLISSN